MATTKDILKFAALRGRPAMIDRRHWRGTVSVMALNLVGLDERASKPSSTSVGKFSAP